jgi:hypothetical protein
MTKDPERKTSREVAAAKKADAWQQVLAEDAAVAKAEAAKTAQLRELRLAREAASAAAAAVAKKPKRKASVLHVQPHRPV